MPAVSLQDIAAARRASIEASIGVVGLFALSERQKFAREQGERRPGAGEKRQRPAQVEGRQSDAGGQDSVDRAFAEARRKPADEPAADHVLDEIVAQGETAGDRQMADHHARQPEGADGAGPAAIEGGHLAQHAQVHRGDEQDVERGSRGDGGEERHPARMAGDEGGGIFIEHAHDVALRQPNAVGRRHDVAGVAFEVLRGRD